MQAALSTNTFPANHKRSALLARPRPVLLYSADAEVYAQGDECGDIYHVEYGAIRIYRLLADGRRQVVAFHLAGETFGFEADLTHSFFAEAIVPTGLTSITMEWTGKLMSLALREMVRAQEHLLVIGRQSALEKLAVFLVDLAERQGGLEQVDLPMTRTDIGDYLGMTIETVSRSFSKLRALGILRLHGSRSIEILRDDKLRRLSQ